MNTVDISSIDNTLSKHFGAIGGKMQKGRKASHTLEIIEQKKLIVKLVGEHLTPMVMAQIKKAIKGDTQAYLALTERAYGKVPVGIDVTSGG